MHVAFVIDSLGSGGAQRQAVEVAVRLRRDSGIRVSFGVYRDFDFFLPRMEEAGISVERLEKRGPLDPAFPARLRAWVAALRPDVVHVFLPGPSVWGAVARRGLAPGAPAWIAAERSSPRANAGPAVTPLLRWAYRRYDAVTANSRPAADELVRRFGLAAERVHYLPNGIDLEAWDRRAAERLAIELEPEHFQLALVGRLSEEKNHRAFLEALSRVAPERRRRLRVLFLGAEDGSARFLDRIRREVSSRGLAEHVRMLPPTPQLPALMARLDGLVLPSRYEGFPNVVLEAMASRLPVLATSVGDVPSLIEDGRSGWRVPAGDVDALAQGLSRLLAMAPEARRAMGAAARAAVEAGYRIETVAQGHLDLYRRLADAVRGDAGETPLG